jgi:Berberine and berberine like
LRRRRGWRSSPQNLDAGPLVIGEADATKESRELRIGVHGIQARVHSYGPSYERLLVLKSKYDPTNFFHLKPEYQGDGIIRQDAALLRL